MSNNRAKDEDKWANILKGKGDRDYFGLLLYFG
jgi:hypothetical protein